MRANLFENDNIKLNFKHYQIMFINNTLGKTFFKGWWHQMAFILHTALNNLIYYIFIVIYSVTC